MIPALDIDSKISYRWYVGDFVKTVGLWKRTETYEFPVYQNTRGEAVFNAAEVEQGNVDSIEPTDAFWTALQQLTGGDDRVDIEGCEWYESEFIREVGDAYLRVGVEDFPMELGQLFAHALEVER